ncbi:unnamed protein product [Urochloa humidicola]
MSSSEDEEIPTPRVKLALDGKNYGDWAVRMRAYLKAVGLWEHITGESPRPPAPAPPPPGAASQDAADAANKIYQEARDAYNGWRTDDARAKLALVDSVEARIIQMPNAQQVWTDLKERYEPPVDAIHYSRLRQLQALQQGSDSVDAFFNRFMSIWGELYSLIPVPDVCRSCSCCVKRQQYDDKGCLYNFLIRLRPEFDLARLMLLDRSPVPGVVDALNVLRVEEIRLQIESEKLSVAAPDADVRCDFCGNYGHTYDICSKRKKKKNSRRGGRHEKGSEHKKGSSEPSKGSSSSISHYEPLVGLPFRYH